MATPADKEKYSHYVAIDFGTAGSTLAFSTSTSQDVHLLSDYSKRRAGEEIKVPTIILLDPDKRYEAFGSKALHCYQNGTVMQRDRFDQYYLFTRFKMTLYSEFPEKVSVVASYLYVYNGMQTRPLEATSTKFYVSEAKLSLVCCQCSRARVQYTGSAFYVTRLSAK